MKKQAIVHEYKHTSTSSWNDRWMMRLKAIEAEYYYIEIQKSYSNMPYDVNILYFAPL